MNLHKKVSYIYPANVFIGSFALLFFCLALPPSSELAYNTWLLTILYFVGCSIPSIYIVLHTKQCYPLLGKNKFSPIAYDYICLIIFFLSFISFVFGAVGSFDFQSASIFAELYRNGFYKGSGIYTQPCLYFTSIVLLAEIYTSSSLMSSKRFWLALIILSSASILLGLRVFLFAPLIHLLVRLNFLNFKGIIVLLSAPILLGLATITYKIYLGIPYSFELWINLFTRLNLHDTAFLMTSSSNNMPFMEILFPIGDTEILKESILSGANQSVLFSAFPFLSKYSGVALPAGVYFLTLGPILSISVYTAYCLSSVKIALLKFKTDSIIKLFQITLVYIMIVGIIEDYPNTFNHVLSSMFGFVVFIFPRIFRIKA